ncbi:MAG: pyridoxamine 5'-phosphate oxidase family protein [Bacteroidetes bacterium]|nr:pyridoxamine 5'-phosphate oxidase family protein [Bacteroidota bacterium]
MKSRVLEFKPELEEIINKCDLCHVAMIDPNNMPYILPFNFGYAIGEIYLHSAQEGKKIDILKNNNNVCVAFSTDYDLRYQNEDVACSYSWKYRSVLAYGKVEFITDLDKKVDALNTIMKNYSDRKFSYNDPAVKGVNCYKVVIERLDGRAYGY